MRQHPISWLLGSPCSVSRSFRLMLLIFAYLMIHGLWCFKPIRKGSALPFEKLGQLGMPNLGILCGCLELGPGC